MIDHKHNFIFVHIPKTAGTSIEQTLNPRSPLHGDEHKHAEAVFYKKKFPSKFDSYFKFTFVRNPWDRAVSYYMWKRKMNRIKDGTSFEQYCELLKKGKATSDSNFGLHSRPAVDWFLDANGNSLLDFIGKFENLQNDFDLVCDLMGSKRQNLKHELKIIRKPYQQYYTEKTKKIIAKIYKKDIQYFGWEFERNLT